MKQQIKTNETKKQMNETNQESQEIKKTTKKNHDNSTCSYATQEKNI